MAFRLGEWIFGGMTRGLLKRRAAWNGIGHDGRHGHDEWRRVEGRIAFLRTELKITDARSSAWNAFADALRTNAKSLGEVRASMMPQ
jgi:hypothetical protein